MLQNFKSNAEAIAAADKYLYGNHARMPIVMDRGEGCYVWDLDGRKFLDFVGGIAVNGLGHCHPAIVKAMEERAHTMLHCSNYYYNAPAIQVCQMIVENSCFEKVLFANSGAEANEGQIKLARKYAVDHGHPERYVVISMLKSFHGRTLATATATGQEIVHNPKWYSPLPEGFRYAEFNNLESVKEQLDDKVCAILTEPVQGEGGLPALPPGRRPRHLGGLLPPPVAEPGFFLCRLFPGGAKAAAPHPAGKPRQGDGGPGLPPGPAGGPAGLCPLSGPGGLLQLPGRPGHDHPLRPEPGVLVCGGGGPGAVPGELVHPLPPVPGRRGDGAGLHQQRQL